MTRDNPDNAPEKKAEYAAKLQGMSDEDLRTETESKIGIWLNAFAANNPISCYHWQCDFTYAEWQRRGKGDEYGKCHKAVMRSEGYGDDEDEEQ